MSTTQRRHATLGSLVFGGVDALGTRIWLSTLKGWDEGVASTGNVEQRAADDGGWPDQAYRAPRVVELGLTLVGPDFLTVSKSINAIESGLPLNALGTLVVDDHGLQLQANVRKSGDLVADRKAAKAAVSLSLIAPDPRRYATNTVTASTGLPVTTGGLVLPLVLPLSLAATMSSGVLSVTNDGNADALPVFTITGPCPAGATITHRGTGASLRFTEAIGAGHTLTIDTASRTAVLDGTASRTVIGTWFSYSPGVNEIGFSASSYDAGALLTSTHRSAWR